MDYFIMDYLMKPISYLLLKLKAFVDHYVGSMAERINTYIGMQFMILIIGSLNAISYGFYFVFGWEFQMETMHFLTLMFIMGYEYLYTMNVPDAEGTKAEDFVEKNVFTKTRE